MAIGGRRALLTVGLGVLSALAGALLLWARLGSSPSGEQLLQEARLALQRGEYAQAEALALRVSSQDSRWGAARLIAGEAATRNDRPEQAINYYLAVPNDGSDRATLALFSGAELCREVGRLTEADAGYNAVLRVAPQNPATHERLAFLLGVTGRRWESRPHFLFLAHSGSASIEELVLLADLERPVEQGEYLRRCADRHPHDVLVQLGLANLAQQEGRTDAARAGLKRVIEQSPELVAAHALLGELLVDADDDVFNQWHQELPQNADESPDIWFVRGLWARRRGELRVAARCFWEAVHRAPVHRRATYQLGQVLVSLGENSGRDFAGLSSKYYELGHELDQVLRSGGHYEAAVHRTTDLLDETGRVLEACAWALLASKAFPESDWPHEILQRRSPLLREDLPQVLPEQNLSSRYDYSHFPDHRQLLSRPATATTREHASSSGGEIRFVDSPEAGIEHVYCNGADPETKGARMFEQTGGGIGVLDLDGDGWPDMYLTQGANWAHGADHPTLTADLHDRLYLNRDGQRYRDVTSQVGLAHRGFGQGCAVGDFDNDG
ncbi:MAG TPA: tetratricopeptide repeat protein, partial [Planctomycetaceae bacterium]|nr:tetratricopeptide repeat protein [Planctomycetaceae bacterium]